MFDRKEYMKQYYIDNIEKEKERNRRWRKSNSEHIKQCYLDNQEYRKQYSREYRLLNSEEISKQRAENRIKNKEKINERSRNWYKTEEGKACRQRTNFKRRARKRNIINTLTSQEWLDILEKHNYKCVYCGCEFDEETLPTRDHIIPISKGGHNTKENVVPACQNCNNKKYNKILEGDKRGIKEKEYERSIYQ